MNHARAASDLQVLVLLSTLTLLWAGAVLHLLQIVDSAHLRDRDLIADVSHAAMGATMTFMLFPGAPADPQPVMAVAFAALTGFFVLRTVSDRHRRRDIGLVLAATNAAMVVMLVGEAQPGRVTSTVIACCLTACAAVHVGRLLPHAQAARPRRPHRLLETGPHLTAAAMTLVMASMFAFA